MQQKDPLDPKINADLQYYALLKTIEFEKYLLQAKKMKENEEVTKLE